MSDDAEARAGTQAAEWEARFAALALLAAPMRDVVTAAERWERAIDQLNGVQAAEAALREALRRYRGVLDRYADGDPGQRVAPL